MFFETNREKLAAFSRLSKTAGARADYVQGGGGNTSVKLDGGLMAIKASGFCLKDIEPDRAYAVLNYEALRGFYFGNEPAGLGDVEKAGAAFTKENIVNVEGLAQLRPSVEAGFHSILKTFVLHTHSVYANLAACSDRCRQIAEKAFADAPYSWGWVPYTDPGANLTFAIRDELKRVEKETGKAPSIILMQNHGVIAHDDDPDVCLRVHQDANERLAAQFGLTLGSFPAVRVKTLENGLVAADTPYLTSALASGKLSYQTLIEAPLYPDQMVFLIGTLFENKKEPAEGEAVADFATGELIFRMDAARAQVITETLCAVAFISEGIEKAGAGLSTMGEAAKNFIANWESEKYRKTLVGKKG